jgi:hypothetical protein
MSASTFPRLLLAASCSLWSLGCGAPLDPNGAVDESEMAGIQIADTLIVGGQAEVYNTGGTALNLRSGAGTGYSVIASMPDGSVVDVLGGPSASFYKVRYGTSVGWAHMNYLRPVAGGGAYPANIHWDAANINNYTSGRAGVAIKWVIIHDMEGSYDGSISWFKDPASQVTAHYCIRSSDGDITQMVREQDTAWHAGVWAYNEAAIGIEHEGYMAAPARWYTDAMYRKSAQLVAAITKRYGIPVDRSHIIGHSDVPPPNTHTDPGPGWDWTKYLALVKSYR